MSCNEYLRESWKGVYKQMRVKIPYSQKGIYENWIRKGVKIEDMGEVLI